MLSSTSVIDAGLKWSNEDKEGYLFVNTCSQGKAVCLYEESNAEFKRTPKQGGIKQDMESMVGVSREKEDSGLTWTSENWAAPDRLSTGPGAKAGERWEQRPAEGSKATNLSTAEQSYAWRWGRAERKQREWSAQMTRGTVDPNGSTRSLKSEALCPNTVAQIHSFTIAVGNKQGRGLLRAPCTRLNVFPVCVWLKDLKLGWMFCFGSKAVTIAIFI